MRRTSKSPHSPFGYSTLMCLSSSTSWNRSWSPEMILTRYLHAHVSRTCHQHTTYTHIPSGCCDIKPSQQTSRQPSQHPDFASWALLELLLQTAEGQVPRKPSRPERREKRGAGLSKTHKSEYETTHPAADPCAANPANKSSASNPLFTLQQSKHSMTNSMKS